MSFASNRYDNYATFFSPIIPGEDLWDVTIHSHTTEELIFLTEPGSCTLVCNGESFQLQTPAFIWNRAGSYHLITGATVDKRRSYVAAFTPKLLDEVSPSQRHYNFMQHHAMLALSLNDEQSERLERLYRAMMGSPIPQRPLLVACVIHQIHLYLKKGAQAIYSSKNHNYIFKVIAALEKLSNTDLTTATLAEQFHVGKTKLEKDFKSCTGHTIHAFRLQAQLQAARLQLITTKKSLSQIAEDCGFTNHSHLIRCFRAEYGITPGQYRKNIQANLPLPTNPQTN